MKERHLTNEEYESILRLCRSLYPTDYKFWGIVLSSISFLLFIVLFAVSYFADDKSLMQAVLFGLLGPGFVIAITAYNIAFNYGRFKESRKLKFDLKERVVSIQTLDVIKAWKVFDPGYNNANKPDWLFKTVKDKWICIPNEEAHFTIPKTKILLHKLKHTKQLIKVESDGNEVVVSDKVIEPENEWRNGDLPYGEVFEFEQFSVNVKNQLKP